MESEKVQYASKCFCPRSVSPGALNIRTDSMTQHPPEWRVWNLCAQGDLNAWKSWGNTTFREYIPSQEA